jgi:hypothetical protein
MMRETFEAPLPDAPRPNRLFRRKMSAFMRSREYAFLLTNAGKDMAALVAGGGVLPGADTLLSGFATSVTATSLTNTGAAWTVDRYKWHVVFAGPNNAGTGASVWGVILTNSATVLTIDRWYTATTPAGAAGTTPNGTCSYVIAMGGAAAAWFGLTENAGAPAAGDTQLTGELVVGTSAGLERTMATYAHTTGTATYTLTKAYTLTGGTARTIQKVGITNSAIDSANQAMLFETALPSPPTLVTNDQLTVTDTVTIS